MKYDEQIDKLFDTLEKGVIEKHKKEPKLKGFDVKGYSKGVKEFYKNLIKTHKIEHDDRMAGLICGHLFVLSGILHINEKYKKDNFLKKYILESMKPMAKITLEVLRKEKLMPETEYKETMKALKVA